MQKKKNIYFDLFFTFFKIGAFTFGGGYAMIPIIQREVAQKKKWITEEDLLDIIAVGESTPGPISVNTATFVGYQTAGVLGAFFATLGLVTPSFVVILIISLLLKEFSSLKAVQYAYAGIRAGVVALLVKAVISMGKKCPKDAFAIGIAIGALLICTFTDISTIIVIIACALCGVAKLAFDAKRRNTK